MSATLAQEQMVRAGVIAIAVGIGAALMVRIVCQIAIENARLDQPNERSSHRVPVPRLGGAAFVPVALAGLIVAWCEDGLPTWLAIAALGGAVGLYLVSLADDIRPLPNRVRFAVHLSAAIGVAWMSWRHAPGGPAPMWWCLLPIYVAGVLNIYNFMDGIDGIAGLQAVTADLAWCVIAAARGSAPVFALAVCLGAAAVGFLTVNWPPAKIFMGDAGSTVLGFFYAIAPQLLLTESAAKACTGPLLLAGVLALWPFLADGTFTILRRLRKRENIFQAHRSHIYQRLVISGLSHQAVTLTYGGMGVLGAAAAIGVVVGPLPLAVLLIGACIAAFVGVWRWAVWRERRPEAGGRMVG